MDWKASLLCDMVGAVLWLVGAWLLYMLTELTLWEAFISTAIGAIYFKVLKIEVRK